MKPNFILNPQLYESITTCLKKKEAKCMSNYELHDPLLFNQIKEILFKFGLPTTQKYFRLIADILLRKPPAEKNYRLLENTLKRIAIKHLSSPAKTNRELLLLTKKKKQSLFDILPLMNYPVDCYNAFIYEKVWIKYNFPIDIVLKEFETYNQISRAEQHSLIEEHLTSDCSNLLELYPLQFIEEFKCFLRSRNKTAKFFISDISFVF